MMQQDKMNELKKNLLIVLLTAFDTDEEAQKMTHGEKADVIIRTLHYAETFNGKGSNES